MIFSTSLCVCVCERVVSLLKCFLFCQSFPELRNDIRASMGRILRMRGIGWGCHGNCLATLPEFVTSVSQFGFLRNLSSYFRP